MPAAPPTRAAADDSPHTMRCLEVWGGNQAVDNGVVMAGLDAWLYSRPFKDQSAGGDLHYVSSCAAGMVTRVLVADVSGHGEKVAEAAGKLRTLMRRYVNWVDQTKFVQGLNAEFGQITQAGGFATAVSATYFAMDDQLTVCNAGHPRPLLYRARTRAWELLTHADRKGTARAGVDGGAANVPLGIVDESCYDQTKVKLATGDLVVLYTDSLIEARGADGKMLGEAGLLALVKTLDPGDPGDFMHALMDALPQGETGPASGDDVTVLIMRPNGLKPRMGAGLMMKMMARLAGATAAAFKGEPFPWPPSGPITALGRLLNRVNPRWGVPRGG